MEGGGGFVGARVWAWRRVVRGGGRWVETGALATYFNALWRCARRRSQARAGIRDGPSLFDYGCLNNFALTLGAYPLLWLVPTRSGIEGNGIFFPEKHQAERQW